MKETTGWKKENPGSKKAREAGAFSGKQKFCTGQECRKVESACRKCRCEAKNRAARLQLQNVPTLASAAAVSNRHLSYEEQLAAKKHQVKELMEKHCKVRPIIGMDENPWHYRHKVQAVFGLDRKKQQISGVYEEKTDRILPVETCLIEDQKADAIIATVRSLLEIV